ncbi:MAG: hypothetical protein CL534_22990 [Ahrensia sp.]|nr:hypothetical protein [Ahrensia sp.]
MTRIFLLIASGLLFLGFAVNSASAASAAVATADVNMRAGPSTAYPVVTVVPQGAAIVTFGCVADYSWCDVGFAGKRGWVSAHYMQVVWRGAPVVVTPAVAARTGLVVVAYNRAYWDTYYVGYPWYGRWAAYPPYVAPRVTSHSRTVDCADGSCTATRSTTGVYGGATTQTRDCTDGACTATRDTTGPYGGTASRTRSCNAYDPANPACTVTRTGPRGASASRTRVWHRQ